MPIKPMTVTVGQLSAKILSMIRGEKTFGDICVKGEISNYSPNAKSGHIYFTLKDERAAIRCVMFRSSAAYLKMKPEDGMSVIVRGNVSCYEAGGYYQIIAADIQEEGAGAQAAEFEKLKAKLEAEGLFARKRPLPEMPAKICVITSESGAALQDILNIIGRRCPQVKILLIPAMMQGVTAPDSIVSAFGKAVKTDADLIIFGRGGGSAEDLSAFNAERVARAVFASPIPTISAVGHEIDFTIADFVADMRAPTPSAAAELAVPDMRALVETLEAKRRSIGISLHRIIDSKTVAVKLAGSEIRAKSPVQRLKNDEQKLLTVTEKIHSRMTALIDTRERSFAHTAAVIEALNPLAVLMRGYSITYRDGKALMSAEEVRQGDRIKIKLSDGAVNAVVESTEKDS
ncbi:MAG TPA: exodeoxyribonuclease VII large subunit [Ruminococcaceae bacterium]|nr:exodeoxyribonuclease VII large subunit [Oscillospiraceae bacterium]